MKNKIVTLLCTILAMTSVACVNTSKIDDQYNLLNTEEPITVTLWHYYAGAAMETLTKNTEEFNDTIGADYGVQIKLISKPSIEDLELELSESAQGVVYADDMPSMFLAYADKILELQELDVISDMNLFFSEEDKSLLIDDFLNYGVIGDEQVMLPVVKSTEVLYLNETYFDEFVSETGYSYDDLLTWDGIMEISRSYYEYTDAMTPDILYDGKAFLGMDSINNFIAVSSIQKGIDIYDYENEKANIDEEILKEIFDYYMEAWALGYIDGIAKYRTDDIRSGDLLAFIGSSAGFVYMPDWIEVDGGKEDIQWGSSQYPYFEGSDLKVVSQGAGIAVSKISDQQQQACALFLNYFWEDNITFALESAYVPVTKDFIDMDYDSKIEMFTSHDLEENEVDVYNLVTEQIEEGRLYQSLPFDGSYTIRAELGNVFETTANQLREKANKLQSQGLDRDEIIEEIDLDGAFSDMISKFYITLESKGVDK